MNSVGAVGGSNAIRVKPGELRARRLDAILADKSEPPPSIIGNGVLLDKTELLVYGKPKSRKTFFALNCGLAIAAGKSFGGFSIPNPHKVLMLSGEGGYFPIRNRIQRMWGTLPESFAKNFELFDHTCLRGEPMPTLDEQVGFDRIRSLVGNTGPRVLVIDPFVRFHRSDENSATEMGRVLSCIRQLIEEFGLSVILLHHVGKVDGQGARGSSAITGEYDSSIHLHPEIKGKHKLEFDMRHVATPADTDLQFDPDTFWFTQYYANPIIRLVHENGGRMLKKHLVEAMLASHRYESDGGAYKGIKAMVRKGAFEIQGEWVLAKN